MDFDAYTLQSLDAWRVPGAAVVVVENGAIVCLAGHGVADVRTRQAVTPDTVFAIASCTKAFAASACALLVSEARLSWDDLVRKHLAHFRLNDALADAQVTLRDLLCHRTGVGAHALLCARGPWGFDEMVSRVAFIEPSTSFRSHYEYNNFLYFVVGQVISAAAGEPWHEFVRRRLFRALGMTRSFFSTSETATLADVAAPHRMWRDQLELIHGAEDTKIRASGSIKTCARDLGAWLLCLLSGGRCADGKVVIPEADLAETQKPQVLHHTEAQLAKRAGTHFSAYALGWHVHDYRGELLLEHSGTLSGFRAHVALLPKRRSGIAVIANLRHTDMVVALSRQVIDGLLGWHEYDWNQIYLQQEHAERERDQQSNLRRAARRQVGTRPSLDLPMYAGVYANLAYGELFIETSDSLSLRWGSLRARLEHFHYDTFTAREDDPTIENPLDGMEATFQLTTDGDLEQVRFLGQTFWRRAECGTT